MRKRILYLFLVFGLLLLAASDMQGRAAAYTAAEQKDATVYITKTGERYHIGSYFYCYFPYSYLRITNGKTFMKNCINPQFGACICKIDDHVVICIALRPV